MPINHPNSAEPELNEGSSLLPDSEAQQTASIAKTTPLPWRQLSVICLIRLAEPISFSVISPFINEMIAGLDESIDPSQVGYYAGLIGSAFACSQFATVLTWGQLSDRWGRRPVILVGIAGVFVSTAVFGFGKSVLFLVAARLVNGVLNGNVAALKCVVTEITDDSNKALAFSFLPLFFAVGGVIGPALGGYLSRPAERIPSVFAGVWLFEEFPYALPCLVASGMTFLGWIAGFFFLEETLDKKPPRSHTETFLEVEEEVHEIECASPHPTEQGCLVQSRPSGYGSNGINGSAPSHVNDDDDDDEEEEKWTMISILRVDVVKTALICYGALALIAVMHDAIWALWLFTPLGKGGLGFSTADIGTALSLYGILGVAIPLLVFPPMQRRLGTVISLRITLAGYVLIALGGPIVTWLANSKTIVDDKGVAHTERLPAVWAGVVILVVLKAASNMAFSCTNLLVNDSPPSKACLGSVNGMAQMTSSAMRAIGPALMGSIFALSASHNWLGGQASWYLLVAMGLVAVYTAFHAVEKTKDTE